MRLTRFRDIFAQAETRATDLCFDRIYVQCVPPFVSLAAPSRKPFPATVIYRLPVIHRASSHRTRGRSRCEKLGKFTGHVDARVRDSRVINEEICRRCRRDKDFIRQREVEIYDAQI